MINSDVAVVMGTRPEMIKLVHVVRQLGDRVRLIHTGQHFDDELSGQIQSSLGLPHPDVVLKDVGGQSRSRQIATCMQAISEEFDRQKPAVAIVQGDTNTVSAAAQAANYAGVPLIHVEAGLRSFDRAMPEEINRLVAGALADVHCAATEANRWNLASSGTDSDTIALTGNTIVEATHASLAFADSQGPHSTLDKWGNTDFALATIHRPENTDSAQALERFLAGLAGINLPVLVAAHPRTRAAIERWGLNRYYGPLTFIDSVPHHDFLRLARAANLLVSDSGGLQEECTVLKKPLVVVRRSTERPESIAAGFAQLVTPEQSISRVANQVLDSNQEHALAAISSPYGDGLASLRIANLASLIADGSVPSEAIAKTAQTYPLLLNR
ncbi:non-hydrolyzing UDP-N-acetylglucosamine 2-epimerase [Paenarthrobacter sp. NPDC056912]|uniref:non-hydrolyzing UDP-N-acetylglucosamine 2-epimerase n=1 Tax=Paenarthrobacter sp. NPDC056912 TaxID=3345965 RepID=UPI00366E1EB9